LSGRFRLAWAALAIIAAWMALTLFWAGARQYGRWSGPPPDVRIDAVANMLWAVLTPFLIYCAQTLPVRRSHAVRNLALLSLAVAVSSGVRWLLFTWLTDPSGFASLMSHPIPWLAMTYDGFFEGAMVVLAGQHVLISREDAERRRAQAALSAAIARARLRQLRGDLHPHLLFNALNSVVALAGENPGEAARVLRLLSHLLRRSFDCVDEEIPLRDEIGFVAPYLDMQRIRFHDRLRVEIDVPDELADCLVPPLILQPLVENAVIHGAGGRGSPALVSVGASTDGTWLHLAVRDSGPGAAGSGGRPGSGTGIANIRERLQLMYGERQELRLRRAPDGFTASVTLPVKRVQAQIKVSHA
jgi:two-component system, LytTR family, sensor kinase